MNQSSFHGVPKWTVSIMNDTRKGTKLVLLKPTKNLIAIVKKKNFTLKAEWAGYGCSSVVGHLSSVHEAPGFISVLGKKKLS